VAVLWALSRCSTQAKTLTYAKGTILKLDCKEKKSRENLELTFTQQSLTKLLQNLPSDLQAD